jgi:hypothetical protein
MNEHFAIISDQEASRKLEDFLFNEKRVVFTPDPEAAKKLGLYPEKPDDTTGTLTKTFSLGRLNEEIFGTAELNESRLLNLFDALAFQRKVRVRDMKIPSDNYRDIRMVCELGCAVFGHRAPKTASGAGLLRVLWYRDTFSSTPGEISQPSLRAEFLRAERDRSFRDRFPVIDAELQSKILSETRLQEDSFKAAILEMLEKIDRKLESKV